MKIGQGTKVIRRSRATNNFHLLEKKLEANRSVLRLLLSTVSYRAVWDFQFSDAFIPVDIEQHIDVLGLFIHYFVDKNIARALVSTRFYDCSCVLDVVATRG